MMVNIPNKNDSFSNGYRYGFNGMERDDELNGVGNSYTTHFRQYDPRLGRWFSRDIMASKYPALSPYNSFGNSPILYTDAGGDKLIVYINSDYAYHQFKSILENKFYGMQVYKVGNEIHIDWEVVTEGLTENEKLIKAELIESEKIRFAESEFGRIINDKKEVKISLNYRIPDYAMGSFRSGLQKGIEDQHAVDTDDLVKLGKSPNTNPYALLMHELFEAYVDAVILGSPGISGSTYEEKETSYKDVFEYPHKAGLHIQSKLSGVDFSINVINEEKIQGAKVDEIWLLTGVKGPNRGEVIWTLTIFETDNGKLNFDGNYKVYENVRVKQKDGHVTGVYNAKSGNDDFLKR